MIRCVIVLCGGSEADISKFKLCDAYGLPIGAQYLEQVNVKNIASAETATNVQTSICVKILAIEANIRAATPSSIVPTTCDAPYYIGLNSSTAMDSRIAATSSTGRLSVSKRI